FHVSCATAMQHAVNDLRRKRRIIPVGLRPGGHDIGMTGKGQQGTGLPTYRPEIVHITKAQTLSPEANGFQAADHHLLTASILGSDRGATDKINSELQGRGQRGHNAASCRDLPGIKAAILPALAGWLDKEWRWGRR